MLTYSGSGSVGSVMPAWASIGRAEPSAATSATFVACQAEGAPARSISWTNPAGSWGRSPFPAPAGVASSSRSFSIATAARRPSGLIAIESG